LALRLAPTSSMITDSTPPTAAVTMLVRAGRSALRPTGTDRERIAHALRVRLDKTNSLRPLAWVARPRGLAWPTFSALALGVVAGGLFVARESKNGELRAPSLVPAQLTPPALRSLAPQSPPALQAATPSEPASAVEQPPSVKELKAHAPQPASDRLAEEVEILSRAQTELHAGRFAAALRVLEDHARRFPHGALAPERHAARVRALCALGRSTEADVELGRLEPGSLHEGRAREACAVGRLQPKLEAGERTHEHQ
jgi:hypothetical protein